MNGWYNVVLEYRSKVGVGDTGKYLEIFWYDVVKIAPKWA
jgi:hypothetical protein